MKIKDILDILTDDEDVVIIRDSLTDYQIQGLWHKNDNKKKLYLWGCLEVDKIEGINAEGYDGIIIYYK